MYSAKIVSCSGWLPSIIRSNHDLENYIDTDNRWIKERTGITRRHIAEDHLCTADLGVIATRKLIDEVARPIHADAIIVASTTSEISFPSIACQIQKSVFPDEKIPCFDIQAVCSGFIYGLEVVDNFIKSGKYNSILFVCAEKMSSIVNWNDRNTCVLFGDGAAATLVTQSDNNQSCIVDTIIKSDGNFYSSLKTSEKKCKEQSVYMEGQKVFKHAVEKMSDITKEILKKNNIKPEEIKFFVPHQANKRIIDCIAKNLQFPTEKIITTVDKHANCSAASIPLAMSTLVKQEKIKRGDLLLCTAFGAGFTWGASIIRW